MEEKQEKPRYPCPNCKCYPQNPGIAPVRGWALYCPWCGGIRYFEYEEKENNNDGKDYDKSGVQQHRGS